MDERVRDLSAFIDARSCSLLRFAYLLTGDHGLAEDLLQSSLIKVYLTWGRIRDRGRLGGIYTHRHDADAAVVVAPAGSARAPWR